MPLYMDVHDLGHAISAEDAAAAHAKDLETQTGMGVDYKTYWVDHEQGKIFCLAEGPDIETVRRVHAEGHGMAADSIHEVGQYS